MPTTACLHGKNTSFSCNLQENARAGPSPQFTGRASTSRWAACRRRRRRRPSGGGDSRPSRPRGAAPRALRARAAAPAPTTARRCRSCSCRSCPCRSCRSWSVVWSCSSWSCSSWSCPSWSCVRRPGRAGRGGRRRRRILAARVGLPLLREGECAADLLLRVRVVEDVGRQLRDRLAVALERIDLADAAVVVPVGDHLVRARLLLREGRAAREGREQHHGDEREAEPQGAMRGGRSMHGAGGRRRECRGVWQVSRLPLRRWCVQGKRIVSLGVTGTGRRGGTVARHGRGPTRDAIRSRRCRARGRRRPSRAGRSSPAARPARGRRHRSGRLP